MKKLIVLLLVLTMAVALLSGCGSEAEEVSAETAATQVRNLEEEEVKIAFIPIMFGSATTIAETAAEELKSVYPNMEINFFNGDRDPNNENTIINECITQEYDAIILEAADTTACNSAVLEAEAAGIPVITINSNCDAVHTLYIQSSSYAAGQKAAEGIVNCLNGKGNVLIYDVPSVVASTTNMGEGMEDYFKDYPDITVLEHQYALPENYSQEGAFSAVSDMLLKYDNVDAIYCTEDALAIGAAQAVHAAGRDGDGIVIWGFDCEPAGLDAIRDGSITGSTFTDRYSTYVATFTAALWAAQTGTTAVTAGYDVTPTVLIPYIGVTAENVEEIAPFTRWDD